MIADVEIRNAEAKGRGVFSLRDFPRGTFIFRRHHGRVVANRDIPSLPTVDRVHLCGLDLDTSAVLLPPGCYLNHSCDPNAMRSGVKVFAWRPIRKGEEITIDYRLNAFGGDHWACACGSPGCTGEVVGSFFSLDEDRQMLYLPFAPAYIQHEYRQRRHPRQ